MIDSFGKIPGFNAALAKSPAAFEGFMALASALCEGALTLRERELIGIAVAQHSGCPYAVWTRSQMARSRGVTGEDLALACAGTARDCREAAIVAFTGRCLREGRPPTDDSGDLSEVDRVEIVANVTYQMLALFVVQEVAPGRRRAPERRRSAAGSRRRGTG